jgi:peptidyl-prolyl cis-trans isomerase A (cyclophilin A)
MKRIAIMLVAAGALAAQAAAQQGTQAAKPSSPPKASSAAKSGSTAARSSYDRALLKPALLTAKAPETFDVKFATTKGDFTVTVTRSWSPQGADRFYNLVRHHFYDNASFFRAISGFMVQFGISAYPPVSSAWTSANIKDDAVAKSNTKGFITFATAGANTRTTQVFINLVDNARLDGMGFSPFGQVTNGMNVVESLYTGYGEGAPGGAGPAQDQIEKLGKPYLDKGFPNLDSIKTATIVGPAAPATPAKPAKVPAPRPSAAVPQKQ